MQNEHKIDPIKYESLISALLDELEKMPSEYGVLAMMQILIENVPYSKEEFIMLMEAAWDELKTKHE